MKILSELLATIPEGNVLDVCIGLHWTAVVVEVEGEHRCGLASTLFGGHSQHRRNSDGSSRKPAVPQAGGLRMERWVS